MIDNINFEWPCNYLGFWLCRMCLWFYRLKQKKLSIQELGLFLVKLKLRCEPPLLKFLGTFILLFLLLFSLFIVVVWVVLVIILAIIFHLISLLSQMVSERQRKESAPPVTTTENGSVSGKTMYFLAEVCCRYQILLFFNFFFAIIYLIFDSFLILYMKLIAANPQPKDISSI